MTLAIGVKMQVNIMLIVAIVISIISIVLIPVYVMIINVY